MIENKFYAKIKIFRLDAGGEYTSNEFNILPTSVLGFHLP